MNTEPTECADVKDEANEQEALLWKDFAKFVTFNKDDKGKTYKVDMADCKATGYRWKFYKTNLCVALNDGKGGQTWYEGRPEVLTCLKISASTAVKVVKIVDKAQYDENDETKRFIKVRPFNVACFITELMQSKGFGEAGVLCSGG